MIYVETTTGRQILLRINTSTDGLFFYLNKDGEALLSEEIRFLDRQYGPIFNSIKNIVVNYVKTELVLSPSTSIKEISLLITLPNVSGKRYVFVSNIVVNLFSSIAGTIPLGEKVVFAIYDALFPELIIYYNNDVRNNICFDLINGCILYGGILSKLYTDKAFVSHIAIYKTSSTPFILRNSLSIIDRFISGPNIGYIKFSDISDIIDIISYSLVSANPKETKKDLFTYIVSGIEETYPNGIISNGMTKQFVSILMDLLFTEAHVQMHIDLPNNLNHYSDFQIYSYLKTNFGNLKIILEEKFKRMWDFEAIMMKQDINAFYNRSSVSLDDINKTIPPVSLETNRTEPKPNTQLALIM